MTTPVGTGAAANVPTTSLAPSQQTRDSKAENPATALVFHRPWSVSNLYPQRARLRLDAAPPERTDRFRRLPAAAFAYLMTMLGTRSTWLLSAASMALNEQATRLALGNPRDASTGSATSLIQTCLPRLHALFEAQQARRLARTGYLDVNSPRFQAVSAADAVFQQAVLEVRTDENWARHLDQQAGLWKQALQARADAVAAGLAAAGHDPASSVEAARFALELGLADVAEKVLDGSIASHPDCFANRLAMADVHIQAGAPAAALVEADTALKHADDEVQQKQAWDAIAKARLLAAVRIPDRQQQMAEVRKIRDDCRGKTSESVLAMLGHSAGDPEGAALAMEFARKTNYENDRFPDPPDMIAEAEVWLNRSDPGGYTADAALEATRGGWMPSIPGLARASLSRLAFSPFTVAVHGKTYWSDFLTSIYRRPQDIAQITLRLPPPPPPRLPDGAAPAAS